VTSQLTEIDHVAIAVNDIDAAIAWYESVFGADGRAPRSRRVRRRGRGTRQVADSYIQLLTPTRDDSPVAKYLAKNGEGLHHVAYRVDNCAAGARGREGEWCAGDRRRAATGVARHDRRLRAPEGFLWHVDRAGRGDSKLAGSVGLWSSTSRSRECGFGVLQEFGHAFKCWASRSAMPALTVTKPLGEPSKGIASSSMLRFIRSTAMAPVSERLLRQEADELVAADPVDGVAGP
jgi:methylmalonyl-CoA epimerase